MCGEEDWGHVALSGESCLVVRSRLPAMDDVLVCRECKVSPC